MPFFDGDDVSNTIEILLIENRVAEAVALSEKIKMVSLKIEEGLKAKPGIKIIMFGGDDLLIEYNPELVSLVFLEAIRLEFKDETGLSMSCGIGSGISQSIQNLRLAKLYGKDQIRGT